jgi:hypothetical protein
VAIIHGGGLPVSVCGKAMNWYTDKGWPFGKPATAPDTSPDISISAAHEAIGTGNSHTVVSAKKSSHMVGECGPAAHPFANPPPSHANAVILQSTIWPHQGGARTDGSHLGSMGRKTSTILSRS